MAIDHWGGIFNLSGRLQRGKYLTLGSLLFLIKYLLDWLVATQGFGRSWSPLHYLIWPDGESLRVIQLQPAEQRFAIVMLAMALPFICIGVILTMQRLRDAGMSRLLIILFFVPMVNLLFIVWLSLVPSEQPQTNAVDKLMVRRPSPPMAGKSSTAAFWSACIISSLLSAGLVFLSANVLKSYGFGLFVLLPFANGWLAAIIYGLPQQRTWQQCVGVGLTSLGLSGVVLILFALEGIICLLMLAPLAIALGALGATVGYAFQWRHWVEHNTPALIIAMVVVIPTLMAAESNTVQEPPLNVARTEVIIAAPLEVVWQYVVSFLPLPEPTEWFFLMGVAYPKHAELVGTGVGAIRIAFSPLGRLWNRSWSGMNLDAWRLMCWSSLAPCRNSVRFASIRLMWTSFWSAGEASFALRRCPAARPDSSALPGIPTRCGQGVTGDCGRTISLGKSINECSTMSSTALK